MKYYVKDYVKWNDDGEMLQVVKTEESKPRRFRYIVWVRE